MNIYLVRHGDTIYKHPDDLSPLSEKGEKEIDALAKFLAPLQLRVSIFHSRKLRAQQTAERLAAGLIVNGALTPRDGLAPGDSVLPVAHELDEATTDIMLVGHMPFMTRLATQLLNHDINQDVVTFHRGTILCLERINKREWVIDWVVHPSCIQLEKIPL
jgi:phosphohistidine phosphatase